MGLHASVHTATVKFNVDNGRGDHVTVHRTSLVNTVGSRNGRVFVKDVDGRCLTGTGQYDWVRLTDKSIGREAMCTMELSVMRSGADESPETRTKRNLKVLFVTPEVWGAWGLPKEANVYLPFSLLKVMGELPYEVDPGKLVHVMPLTDGRTHTCL
jgi:hypothetical protein